LQRKSRACDQLAASLATHQHNLLGGARAVAGADQMQREMLRLRRGTAQHAARQRAVALASAPRRRVPALPRGWNRDSSWRSHPQHARDLAPE